MFTGLPITPAEMQSILSTQAIMALGRGTAQYGLRLMESVRAGLADAREPSKETGVADETPPALFGL